MTIAMSDGATYENSLDMLFAKDMPSREETDRQQKMKDMDSTMPHDMRGPPSPEAPTENNQLSEPSYKDQNDPYSWGMGSSMDRKGPAMVPLPEPKFHDIMDHLDYLINPESIPANAQKTSAETAPKSPYGETYDKFVEHLEAASKFLNPSFIPSAEEFRDAPWKEKLGFMIGTSMMMLRPTPGAKPPSMEGTPLEFWKGNAGKLDEQALEHYRKLDTPVAREEFSNMIKKKIDSASEGGETSTTDITKPEIRGMKEGSDWSEVITKPDGTKETVYDQAKIERLRNLLDNGLTFKEIGEKMDVSRNSVNSMVRRLKTMDAEEVTPSEKKANSPWSPAEDKILTTWHKDPNSDLFETPALLKHRSEGAINARIKTLGLEKAAEEEASAQPFVPKGAVRAPETGGGSGGPPTIDSELQKIADHLKYNRRRETELEGKSGIGTPNIIPEDAANQNKSLQIKGAEEDAILDKMWKNMGVALEKGISPVSPVLEAKMNPVGKKNLKQFETEMDYKYKDENRGWISQLNDKEVEKYKSLINRSVFQNENSMQNSIQRMLNPKEPDVQKQIIGSPREKAIASKNSNYPTTEDAYAARAYDQFRGEDVDAYTKGKVARILGSVDKTGKVIPKAGLTDDLNEFMRGIMKESESKNVDLTKKENWKYADKLADEFTKAAIVSKRVPIAGLGFDPSKVVVDLKMDDIGRSTIGGAYMAPGPEGKGSDATYANFQGAGTIIHESIHRGLEKLRERKDLRGAFANLPADEESLTRYIMYKHAGDPEGDAGKLDAKQRADAIRMFEDSEGKTWARYEEAINKITKAAQDEIKKRRPGGHR